LQTELGSLLQNPSNGYVTWLRKWRNWGSVVNWSTLSPERQSEELDHIQLASEHTLHFIW